MRARFGGIRGDGGNTGAGCRLGRAGAANSIGEARGGNHEQTDEGLLVAGSGLLHCFDGVVDDFGVERSYSTSVVSEGLLRAKPSGNSAQSLRNVGHPVADLHVGGAVCVVAADAADLWSVGRLFVAARRRRAAGAVG